MFQIIVAITSGVFLIFASDSIGFIFSSIFLAYFNKVLGGYAGIYTRHLGNLNEIIATIYKRIELPLKKDFSPEKFEERWKQYNTEHFLINFFWHRPGGATDNLGKWVERRHTAYFTSGSFCVAAAIATILSVLIIYGYDLGFTWQNLVIVMITVGVSAIIIWNGKLAMQDAIAITDLHVAGFVNAKVREILKQYSSPTKETDTTPKPSKLK